MFRQIASTWRGQDAANISALRNELLDQRPARAS